MESFPIVRGVGNLFWNLGFNQSAFLVTSFLDSLLPERIGLWLVGGLLPWLGLTLSSLCIDKIVFQAQKPRDLASRSPMPSHCLPGFIRCSETTSRAAPRMSHRRA